MKRISLFAMTGVAATLPFLLVGCSGGATSTLATPTLAQPGGDSKSATPDASKSAADQAKSDEAAMKAPRTGIYLTGLAAKAPAPYTHVWATITKVEFLDDKDVAQTVWDGGTEGKTIDLTTLAGDGLTLAGVPSNRFLALAAVPGGAARPTTRVRVTFGKALELYQTGKSTGETTLLSDSISHDAEGHPTMSYALSKPRDLSGGKDNLVVEFDLSKLAVKDGKASVAIADAETAGLKDSTRQIATTFSGTVSGITGGAPESKFILNGDTSGVPSAVVETTGATALYNDDATPSPTLADKRRVAVIGILAPDTKRIAAAEISVLAGDKASPGGSLVEGSVSHVNPTDKTFVIDARSVEGIDPTLGAITVAVAPDAVLRSRGGLLLKDDDFWTALSAKGEAPTARVSGTYDPVTGTLTARRAKFETISPASAHEADIQGAPKLVDIDAHTFTVQAPLVQWEGIEAPGDKSRGIPVTITAATGFRDENGKTVAQAGFFDAALAAKAKGEIVRVVGLYSKGGLTATRVEIRPAPAVAASPSPSPAGSAATSAQATSAINAATSAVSSAVNGSNAPASVKAALTPATPAPTGP